MKHEEVAELVTAGMHKIITDRALGADLSSQVIRNEMIGGGAWEVLYRATMLGSVVWKGSETTFGPRWLPKFLRLRRVSHYHVCPHLPVSDQHYHWLVQKDA